MSLFGLGLDAVIILMILGNLARLGLLLRLPSESWKATSSDPLPQEPRCRTVALAAIRRTASSFTHPGP